MSTVAAPRGARAEPRPGGVRARPDVPAGSPWVRVLTFSALGLYGSLRWATLVAPAATGRMLVLVAFAATAGGVIGGRAQLGGRSRMIAALGVLVLMLAAMPVCGVPLSLVVHLHLGAIADGIGLGLTALPRAMVPYGGVNAWTRTVILLGGGMLLLDAGVLLAFVPHSLGDARRAGAALPLIALAVVPATLEAPHVPYLQGLLLFVLVAAFVWGERLERRQVAPAIAVAALAGVAGVLAAPGLDIHRPLLNYQSIANSFSPAGIETFQWYQGYGPYNWPTDGQQVLHVNATHPEFWKTQNLDNFDGRGWVQAPQFTNSVGAAPPPTPEPSPGSLAAWTQTLRITIGAMYTANVVASGTAQAPQHVPGGVTPGASPGTWNANKQLGPGDAYEVRVYAPNPIAAQLETASTAYPATVAFYRQLVLPTSVGSSAAANFTFPAFGSSASARTAAVAAAEASPYAPAYHLARRLAAGASTPYGFVTSVQRYLQRNYTYSTYAPISSDPIETFLFKAKYGYCQQFAGAMALLLRMGGIPARVAVGFTSGAYGSSTGEFRVVDTDAHAWVEVWFPDYGWVAFNPTPQSTPGARSSSVAGRVPLPARGAHVLRNRGGVSIAPAPRRHGSGSVLPVAVLATVGLLLVLGGAGVTLRVRRRAEEPPSSDELLSELERALRRSSFELTPATTLTDLERRFRRSPGAVAYVRSVGRARYGDGIEAPTPGQRRALRAALADGRGSFARIRALWALPPRL